MIAWVTPGEGQERTGRIVGPSREVEDSWGEDDAPPAHSLPHMEIDANRPSDGHMPLLTCFSATNLGQGPCSPLQPGAYQPFSRAQTPGQAPSTAPPFTSPVTSCVPCPAAVLSSLLHSGKPPRPPVGVKGPPHTLGETLGHCPLCAIIVWFMSAPHRAVTTTALERMPDSRYPMS